MSGFPSIPWKAVATLVLVVVISHLATLGNDFIWDDDRYVTENTALRSFSGLKAIWTDPATTPQYYPLTHTTFWVEYQLWELDPAGYHAVNVGLHALCAALLYLILRALGIPGAWLAAAIFAVHPIQVESVAWITERKNVLSGSLYMGSLLCWVRYFRLGEEHPEGEAVSTPGWAALGACLFALALLSKTVTVTLPVTLAVIFWWKRRRPGSRMLVFTGAMVTSGVLLASLTSWLEKHQVNATGAEWSLSIVERTMVAGRAWWFYLGKILWPDEQIFIYPRWAIDGADTAAWGWPLLALLTLTVLWVLRDRIGRGPLAAMLHYSVALAPALGFFNVYPMRYSFVADHFQYLAGIGPIVGIVAGLVRIPWPRSRPVPALVRQGLSVLLVAVLGLSSWQRAAAYADRVTLWEDTLSRNNGAWIAHNNLGILYAERGREDEARDHFLEAIRLKPDHVGARSNLGLLLLQQGRAGEALPHVEAALALDPDDFQVWIVLGELRRLLNDPSGATAAYRSALALEPGNPRASLGLGDLELRARNFEEAARLLANAARAVPENADVRLKLGSALAALGRLDAAMEQFLILLSLQPDDAEAHYNLGTLLARTGRAGAAERHLAEALRLRPGFTEAERNLRQVREQRTPAPGTGRGSERERNDRR
jgi:tetratricopeptide (TPR) repeat protein